MPATARGIADAWLVHDREIVNRVDDSVVRVCAGAPRILRRARGYAPAALALARWIPRRTRGARNGRRVQEHVRPRQGGQALLSQHPGDLEDSRTFDDYRARWISIREYSITSRRWSPSTCIPTICRRRSDRISPERHQIAVSSVQHHHAHIASCMAENAVALKRRRCWASPGRPRYGRARRALGRRFLLADYRGFRRSRD
jgi:hydrogenase maturation protein HypF